MNNLIRAIISPNYSLLLLVLGITLSGCNQTQLPESQQAFNQSIEKIRKNYNEAVASKNDFPRQNAEAEFVAYLRESSHVSENWAAEVATIAASSRLFDDPVSIIAEQDTQIYHLLISDSDAVNWAKNLKKGDRVVFSGTLGKEQSLTISGGISAPEFRFYPNMVGSEGTQQRFNQELAGSVPAIAAIIDIPKIAGKAEEEAAEILGPPSSCENVKQGKKCFYQTGEIEVVFISGKADWITVNALDSAPYSEDALPLLGLERSPASFSNDFVMRWSGVPTLLEVSIFSARDHVDYAYIKTTTP